MPEGPECRRVSDGLIAATENKILTEISVLGGRFLKKAPTGLESLALPSKVIGGGVKGKFIWLELENEMTLWITLGMSGFWSQTQLPHAHISLAMDDGSKLYFIDQRRFGTFKIAPRSELGKKLKTLGLDPLNDQSLNFVDMLEQLKRVPTKNITQALMDQRLFAGIGNYIKCEMLYCARVNPFSKVGDLDGATISLLWNYCVDIMINSYASGGASIRNYQMVDESKGEYAFTLKVYAQKTDPFGNLVERIETPDGRTTHWVPAVQS